MKKGRQTRFLRIETLETREMLSLGGAASALTFFGNADSSVPANSAAFSDVGDFYGPSPQEQEMLELINRMRTDPQGELHRLIKSFLPYEAWDPRVTMPIRVYPYPKADVLVREWASLTAAAPLAWNSSLAIAATDHSYAMMVAGKQSHQLEGEPALFDRVVNAGFEPIYKQDEHGDYIAVVSENVYAHGQGAEGTFSDASFTHAAFAIDWNVPTHDHRDNIMNPLFTEVGVSMLASTNPMVDIGPWVTTVDFAASQSAQGADGAYLLGVLFDDANVSGYYEAGEGLSDVTITITPDDGSREAVVLTSYSAGGYQVYLENGLYSITVSGQGFAQPITKYVVVEGENVKVDFTLQEASDAAPVLDLNGPVVENVHYNVSFFEAGEAIMLLASNATLVDEDSTRLSTMKVTLHDRPDGPNEYLLVDTGATSLQSNYDSLSGELLIYGNASVEDYLAVLKTLRYGNAALKADLGDRLVTFAVSDGVRWSETAETRIAFIQQTFETLAVGDVRIAEGDDRGELTFHFELTDIPRCDVLVEYEFVDATAVFGTHYDVKNDMKSGTLLIAADRREAFLTVEIIGDYLPGDDVNFTLNIKSVTGALCDTLLADAVIVDDDTPQELGNVSRWHVADVDLTDGYRRLYSFTPSRSGQVVWEATLAENGAAIGHVEMFLFKDSHVGQPLYDSTDSGEKARLEGEIVQGETYVLLLEGDVPLDELRMVQVFLLRNEIDDGLDFFLDPEQDEQLLIDLLEGSVRYNGVEVLNDLWNDFDYSRLGFEHVAPNHVVRITGNHWNSTGVVNIDPEKPGLPDGFPPVDLGKFTRVQYDVTDPEQTVFLKGTEGDDAFEFLDGVATFRTSKHKIITVRGGRIFDVDGNGGNDCGVIYDTVGQDRVFMETDRVRFEGGGNSGYLLDVSGFTVVDVSSYYGGGDSVTIRDVAGSRTHWDDWRVRRLETHEQTGTVRKYSASGFSETIVDQTAVAFVEGNAAPPVSVTGRGERNTIHLTPGRVLVKDAKDAYRFTVLGDAPVIHWNPTDEHTGWPTIFIEQPEDARPSLRFDGTHRILDTGFSSVRFETNADLNFYLNSEKNSAPGGADLLRNSGTSGVKANVGSDFVALSHDARDARDDLASFFHERNDDATPGRSLSRQLPPVETERVFAISAQRKNENATLFDAPRSDSDVDFPHENDFPRGASFESDSEEDDSKPRRIALPCSLDPKIIDRLLFREDWSEMRIDWETAFFHRPHAS